MNKSRALNNCSRGALLPDTDVYRSVRHVPDLADEADIMVLAFPHAQLSIEVLPRPVIEPTSSLQRRLVACSFFDH